MERLLEVNERNRRAVQQCAQKTFVSAGRLVKIAFGRAVSRRTHARLLTRGNCGTMTPAIKPGEGSKQ